MNEQFSKLLQECIVPANQAVEYSKSKGFVIPDEKLDVAKFAELIVKECLKELKDMIVDESELLYPNNKQTTECVNDRLMDAYDNITELFGVEE